jgi:uncharacterized membrane protein
MDVIERIALSGGMSIAVVGLIGFGLNYSAWGIKLEPVLYSITAFVFVTSAIALIRRWRTPGNNIFTTEYVLRFPSWGGSTFNKSLSIILIIAIFCALGVLGYSIATPKIGERFTEFYILGIHSKAQDYPIEFTLYNAKVTQVAYGDGTLDLVSGSANITAGIVNHEQRTTIYTIKLTVDNESVNIISDGKNLPSLENIELKQGEKWEATIGFIPRHTGDNQTVELLLFNGDESMPDNSLRLWINVNEVK